MFPVIQQSLADSDPDVDAIYRLTIYEKIKFSQDLKFSLKKNVYCPFNSQNTYWHKSVFSLLYLPSTVNSRVTDIWRGYIAQRLLWEIDSEMIFISPSVYQKRNIHNFMKDFKDELDLYLKSEELVNSLREIELRGSIENMLISVYKKLVKEKFFQEKELKILETWLELLA